MMKSCSRRTVAAAALALPRVSSSAQAAAELVVWHAYRGAEKTAFEKVVGMLRKSPARKASR